jgi:hypothetical protein
MRARAFQAIVVTDNSVKSRNNIHVVAMETRVEDNASEGGGGFSRKT